MAAREELAGGDALGQTDQGSRSILSPASTAGIRPDADRRVPPTGFSRGANGPCEREAVAEAAADGTRNRDMVATAGGEMPGTHLNSRGAPRPEASGTLPSGASEGGARPGVSSLRTAPASERASGSFSRGHVLVTKRATVDDVARACLGNLVAVTLPDQGSDMATMAAASAFGAQLQARGVFAVSPIGIAARHRFSAIEAGADVPPAAQAVDGGYGRVLMARADALAVLCLPGWGDCQRVAVDISEALLSNRRVFMVSR